VACVDFTARRGFPLEPSSLTCVFPRAARVFAFQSRCAITAGVEGT